MSTPVPVPDNNGLLVDELADWLMASALDETTPEEVLTGCCERLVAADLPLARVQLGFRTLHPLFQSVSITWRAGEALEVDEHPHGMRSAEFLASPHHALLTSGIGRLRRRLEGDAVTVDYPVLHDLRAQGATDYVAWVVSFGSELHGEVSGRDGLTGSWTTRRPGGFTDADLRVLKRIERRLAVACKVSIKSQIARNVLRAYLGDHAGERVWAGSISRGSGENIHAVIWFADLRDSTRLSEEMPLAEFLALLNDFFECIAGPVLDHGGEVLRFIGDAVLAVFPMEGHHRDDFTHCPVHRAACATALAAARDAMARVADLNARRAGAGAQALRYGIGLHVGDVMYGNIGVPSRVEFSVVGATANHAAKIESLCKSLDVPMVVSADFAALVDEPLQTLGRHRLPGAGREQEVFTLSGLAGAAHGSV